MGILANTFKFLSVITISPEETVSFTDPEITTWWVTRIKFFVLFQSLMKDLMSFNCLVASAPMPCLKKELSGGKSL